MNDEQRMISTSEAARLTGLAPGTLANYRSRKVGPKFYRLGRRKILYRVDELQAWIMAQPVNTAGPR